MRAMDDEILKSGRDLAQDFENFLEQRVKPVFVFVAEQGGPEALAMAKTSFVGLLRTTADAFERAGEAGT
jgi:hypothetical protein